jgi:serine/threonine protein phosphatase 1
MDGTEIESADANDVRLPAVSPWRNARTPEDCRVYAIGDIHGRADLLISLLDAIEDDIKGRPPVGAQHLVFLGDYIDRGLYSQSVVEVTLHGIPEALTPVFLKGNHEALLLDYLDDASAAELWVSNGGLTTLESYDLDWDSAEYTRDRLLAGLPRRHLEFFEQLELCATFGDYFFCHAGVRPGCPVDEQLESSLLWIRDVFLEYDEDFGKVVVHGHTPRHDAVDRRNRIGVDTRAWQSDKLTAVGLEGDQRWFLNT